jgi:NDP-sugar pyrophosphorylase family protein
MIDITSYVQDFKTHFPASVASMPWLIVRQVISVIEDKLLMLDHDYIITGNVAVHKSARIDEHITIKGPAIISANCFIGAHAYLRGGVFVGEGSIIGPGCEVKSCIILHKSALAHFNFTGDSIIGSNINMEAGAVVANHYNERDNKEISVRIEGKVYNTGTAKFGALVGDNTKIGANAVLSPGTILKPNSVVERLKLIEQMGEDIGQAK